MMTRINLLQRNMAKENIDCVLITDKYSINYLTGEMIEPGERLACLIISQNEKPVFVINKLFLRPELEGFSYDWILDTDNKEKALSSHLSGNIIGIDKIMPARFLLPLMDMNKDKSFVLASFLVDSLRAVKDDKEIELMRKASKINDAAMELMRVELSKNRTEKEMAAKLIDFYKEYGSYDYSFEPIVAYGKNAADPHHENDDSRPSVGDSIVVDMGCIYKGYCSDMTRTFFYKRADEESKKVYEIVKEANQRAIAGIRPGVLLKDIDALARDYIIEKGYGEYFTHRTGHFIGSEVHELPDVSMAYDLPVEVGNIFSIEPGIYIKDKVGVRIEDLVLVTENGCEVLNSYPKDVIIIE